MISSKINTRIQIDKVHRIIKIKRTFLKMLIAEILKFNKFKNFK